MTQPWQALERELDAWRAGGQMAQLWWRDDDATAPGEALDRLLDLAAEAAAPVSLAVIPEPAQETLAQALATHGAASRVLQHGIAHRNLAPAGEKKCELVGLQAQAGGPAALHSGLQRLQQLFGDRFLPVLVPPWNRIAADLLPRLPGLGYCGLSTYRARDTAAPVPGLRQVNCHLDILQWRPERRFLGTAPAIDLLVGHLAAKRRGAADPAEPSGILSHHLVHDEAAWRFLAELLSRLGAHSGARLLGAEEVFAAPAALSRAAP